MLDKDAQKSLLDNAATVNQAILDVCQANVKEYTDKLESFTDLKTKVTDENAKALHIETFGKEARQSLNIKTLLDLPDMKKDAVEKVIEIMKNREKEDEVVAKTIKIEAAATSASTTTVIPTTTFTAYYKSDWDVTYWVESGVFSVVLPIFKEDDSTNLVITINASKEISSEFMSDDDVQTNFSSMVTRSTTYQDEIDAIEKTDKYKEWENADSYFKSAREINAQMETDKKNALAKIEELKILLAAKETALTIATSNSDSAQEAALTTEIKKINDESLPAEQLKVDQETISDGFRQKLKASEDAGDDWFDSLLTNAKAFDKSDLFKGNKITKVFTKGKDGKDLNLFDRKDPTPLWFISSSINAPLGTDFLKNDKVKKVIQKKIQKGEKFYSIKTGEQFTDFDAFLNFDKST